VLLLPTELLLPKELTPKELTPKELTPKELLLPRNYCIRWNQPGVSVGKRFTSGSPQGVAMLAAAEVKPPGHAESWPLTSMLGLRATPGTVPHARHFVANTLRRWNFTGQVIDDAEIVTSELVTNAVQACQANRMIRLRIAEPIVLSLRSNFASAVIEVDDPLSQLPQINQDAQVDTEGGRGLVLVELFSQSWGYYMTAIGKCVWASFVKYE
jgi:hypothetical protein